MSSLIEQAAKRLEELRRAGVGSPDDQPAAASAPPQPAPSVESAIRALEGRAGAMSPSLVRPERRDAPHPERRDVPHPERARAVDPSRHVEIDFARMKARGFVTPDAGASQIAEEFRVIKRPIIRNAVSD